MKRILFWTALGAFLMVFWTGCASIRRSTRFHDVHVEEGYVPIESVEIENSNWYLFMCVPLAGGDTRHPNQNTCRAFVTTATLQNNMNMLDSEMKKCKATKLANLTSRHTEETFLFFFLSRKAYHTSAILLDNK